MSLACLLLGALRLPKTPVSGRRPGVDLGGMALFAAMLTALLLFLMSPRSGHWYLLALTAAAAAGLVVRERRVNEPFIDLLVFGGNLPRPGPGSCCCRCP